MSLSKVFFTVVFVLHNFADSLSNPVIWTARDSLSTNNNDPVEIITPVSQSKIVFKEEEEEILPTRIPYFPTEMIYSPTEISHISTEISHIPTETSYYSTNIPDFPREENKTIPMPNKNRIVNRIPKFLGRLAFLAGLGLAGLANAASAIDLDPKDPQTPSTLSLPPAKLSPYFAAVYEPFSFSSQPNFYSNLFGLFPFLVGSNPQKFQTGGPSSVAENSHNPHQQLMFTPPDDTGHEVVNQELYHEEYVVENRKDDDNTTKGSKSGGNVIEQKKSKPTKATILQEDTTSDLPEEQELEEGEDAEEREDIEENDESTEDYSEENSDSEDLSYDLFSSKEEQTTLKPFKRPVRPAQQKKPTTTTRRPKTKKPTKRKPHKKPTTTQSMKKKTDTNSGNATTGYPHFYGYYGGNPQNVHDIFITSSERPHTHESYNEIPHYSEDWSNRGPIDHNSFDGPPDPHYEYRFPIFDQVIPSENTHFFRGFPVMETTSSPAFINTGFKPSYQYS